MGTNQIISRANYAIGSAKHSDQSENFIAALRKGRKEKGNRDRDDYMQRVRDQEGLSVLSVGVEKVGGGSHSRGKQVKITSK